MTQNTWTGAVKHPCAGHSGLPNFFCTHSVPVQPLRWLQGLGWAQTLRQLTLSYAATPLLSWLLAVLQHRCEPPPLYSGN